MPWYFCKICKEHKEWIKDPSKKTVYKDEKGRSWKGNKCPDCCFIGQKCKIKYTNCEVCDKVMVYRTMKPKTCSRSCKHKLHYTPKKYSKQCTICNTPMETKYHNKATCSDKCRKKHNSNVSMKNRTYTSKKTSKECKTCGKEFIGGKREKYCSKECRTPPKPKKSCKTCKKDISPRNIYCSSCKPPKYQKVEYLKVCPACDKSFIGKRSTGIYCTDKCNPNVKQSKKLRKRTKRRSKLNVESWKDIDQFIEKRPQGAVLDHIVPLNHPDVCGLHNTWNFQWLTPEDNGYKSNKFDGTTENDSWRVCMRKKSISEHI